MRNGDSSRQLTLIIVLIVVLIFLVGALLVLTLTDNKEASAPADEISSKEEESVSIPMDEIKEEIKEEVKEEIKEELAESEEPSEAPAPKPAAKPQYKPTVPTYKEKVFGDEGASYEAKEIIGRGYITKGSISLANRTFNENLYITADVGDRNIVLNNVIVKGKIVINGAGTVTLHSVKAHRVEINTEHRDNNLIVSGSTTVDNLILRSSCKIDEDGLNKGYPGVKNIVIEDNPKYLWLDVELFDGRADGIYAGGIANIYADDNSSIGVIQGAKMCHLYGSGTIDRLNVYESGITYSNEPEVIEIKNRADEPEYSEKKIDGKVR